MMKRFLLGILVFGSLMSVSPATAQVANRHVLAAQEYMRSGQWDYASYEWRSALAENPRDAAIYEGLARCLLKSGLTAEAVNLLRSLPTGIDNANLALLFAEAQQRSGNTRQAIETYLSILRKYPTSPVAYRQLKSTAAGLPAAEKQDLNRKLQAVVQDARAKGDALYGRNRYGEAIPYYRMVLNHTGRVKDANNLGLSLLLAGRRQEAARVFDTVVPNTKNWRFVSNAALAQLAIGKPYQARMLVQKAIAMCPDKEGKAYLYNHLGYIYETSKKYAQARFTYEKALALKQDYRKARMNQAYIFRKDGLFAQALAVYKTMLKTEPDNAELWNQIGYAQEMQHAYSAAFKSYRKAIALNPQLKEAHMNLAMLYKKTGEKEKAEDSMRQVMEIEFQEAEKTGGKIQAASLPRLTDYVEVFPADNAAVPSTVSVPLNKQVSQR